MKHFSYQGQVYRNIGEEGGGNLTGALNGKFYSIPKTDVEFLFILDEEQKEKIAFFQEIVDTKSFKEDDDMIYDLFTASIVVQIYEALNDKNKAKLLSLSKQDICYHSLKLANQLQL